MQAGYQALSGRQGPNVRGELSLSEKLDEVIVGL